MPPKRKAAAAKVVETEEQQNSEATETAEEPPKAKKGRSKVTKTNVEINNKKPDIKQKDKKEPKKKAEPVTTKSVSTKTVKKDGPQGTSDEKPRKARTAKKPSKDKNEEEDEEEEEQKPKRGQRQKGAAKKEQTEKPLANKSETNWEVIDFGCSKTNAAGKNYSMKITSWNVDGLRAWLKKDGLSILKYDNPDILCLQETKCDQDKHPDEVKSIEGYNLYWCDSDKAGYAGVALFSKTKPIKVTYGIEAPEHDEEGRCISAEYDKFYVVSVYVPNAGRKLVTLPKRLDWNEAFMIFIKKLDKKKPVIICGDMNVAHNEIDLANPKTNTKNAGFTKEEREGMTDFLEEGFVDTYRELYPDKTDVYTFWSYMMKARSKNVGWRLDYFILSERIVDKVCDNVVHSEVYGSDHCPVTLFINL